MAKDRVKMVFEGKTMADVIRQMVETLVAVNAVRKEENENGTDQSAGSGNAGAGQRQQ